MNKIRDEKEKIELQSNNFLNMLLSQDQIIPITEDFLRYHKKTEKYNKEQLIADDIKERDATKIKIILNKINKVKNLYSSVYEKMQN